MNLGAWDTYIRSVIPTATVSSFPATLLYQILNSAVLDITKKSLCLKANIKFNVVSGQSEYVLSSLIPDYLVPDKSGLFWNNGTNYVQVYRKSLKWFDDNYPNWRSLTSAKPRFYSIDDDILTVLNTPDTSLTNGFWFYYIPMPVDMSNQGDFPFVGAVAERMRLRIFDEAIEAYARWKILPALDKDNKDLSQEIYDKTLGQAIALYNRQPDISSEITMRVRQVC